MRRNYRFWTVDLFTFISQIILSIVAMIYGLISSHEIFIPIGLALGSGGIGSLSSLISYIKKHKNTQSEMFDERADLISGKATSIAFKITFIALEAAFLISILPYKMPYYVFPFAIGFIMFASAISYLLARQFYGKRN